MQCDAIQSGIIVVGTLGVTLVVVILVRLLSQVEHFTGLSRLGVY